MFHPRPSRCRAFAVPPAIIPFHSRAYLPAYGRATCTGGKRTDIMDGRAEGETYRAAAHLACMSPQARAQHDIARRDSGALLRGNIGGRYYLLISPELPTRLRSHHCHSRR